MHILIFSKTPPTRNLIALALNSHLDVEVSSSDDLQSAMEILLDEQAVDLIIYDLASGSDHLLKFILSADASIPVAILSANNEASPYPDLNVIGTFSLGDLPDALTVLLHKHQADIRKQESEYCQIAADLLVKVGSLSCDIYIRLSSVKFIKLFREGTAFTKENLNHVRTSKKIQYLYLRTADAPEFISLLKSSLTKTKASPTSEIGAVVETVHELIHRIGFTPDVQNVARESVRLALDAIGASPKLSEALEAARPGQRNYISSHSLMLATLASCIAASMKWPSKTTFQKLGFAAFFHDISFKDQKLASMRNMAEATSAQFSEQDLTLYREHPLIAAELVKTMAEVPPEVDVIVAQHHERPAGDGFPQRLPASRIAPLSSVFIVAHDLLHEIREQKGEFHLQDFLQAKKEEYKSGNFKKIWESLSRS